MTYFQWSRFHHLRKIVFALSMMSITTPIYSQTTFEFPSDSVDISRYQTVWECLVASTRMEKSIEAESAILVDTMAPIENPGPKLLPVPVIELARHCGTQAFRLNEPSKNVPYYIRLYLKAGQDSLAFQTARHHLTTLTQGDTAVRNLYLRELITEFVNSTPARLSIAWEYLNVFDSVTNGKFYLSIISGYSNILEAAEENGDSVRALAAAKQVVAIVDKLTEKERSQEAWQRLTSQVTHAYDVLYGKMWLDSLKHVGTEKYVELIQKARARMTGKSSSSTLLYGVGEKAPPIVGDYWFPQKPGDDIPHTNVISLVMFIDQRHVGTFRKDVYLKTFTSLRRLKQQFPKLEVVVVTRTLGWFGESVPPEPTKEAELLGGWIRDFFNIDAVVSVSKTSFFRLPGSDRRRINQDTENEQQYSFGNTVRTDWFPAFLIDSKGTVVLTRPVNNKTESEFVSMLRALHSQNTQDIH